MEHQSIIFQVTLPSGMVATNPAELALARLFENRHDSIITHDGRVLVAGTGRASEHRTDEHSEREHERAARGD
jgi:hypothetical protein